MNIDDLYYKIEKSDRKSLAKAITLIESQSEKDKEYSSSLLKKIAKSSPKDSVRLGVTGIPGVGKSHFIEVLGQTLLKKKLDSKIGIITIDPSSPKRGGSILGDKIRMSRLAGESRVFIRPCSSKGATRRIFACLGDIISLLEFAGYSFIIVESVGVGQEEYELRNFVDLFLLMQMPATGDVIQCLKKGILELADIIVVNKADGNLKASAHATKQTLEMALNLVQDRLQWKTPVICTSGLTCEGIDRTLDQIDLFFTQQKSSDLLSKNRKRQQLESLNFEVLRRVKELFFHSKSAKKIFKTYQQNISSTRLELNEAAEKIIKYVRANE